MRATRRTGQQHCERKSDSGGDQQRSERIILHGPGDGLLTAAQVAAVIGIPGVVNRGIGSVSRGVLGLAVQILHRACGFTRPALGLRPGIAGDAPDGALETLPTKSFAEPEILSLSIAVTPV